MNGAVSASAIVSGVTGTGSPAASPRASAFERSGSTATTRTPAGTQAAAIPETRPPPPQATTIVSTPGTSSRISSPTVPAPAITIGSSNGWTKVRPVCSRSSWSRSKRRARARRLQIDRGAVAAGGVDLRGARALPHHEQRIEALGGRGPRERLRVVPGRDADHAGLALVGESALTRLSAPRALNEPVRWKSSALR